MTASSVSPWPRRAARIAIWIACLATLPIFLIGGTVTTLRVGMAVPDWPTTFGQNMFTYPLRDMLASTGVSWEHSHRLWGAFVGVCVVVMAIAMWASRARASVRWLSVVALLGVVGQGVLGGLRVTENSPELAFVHGASAQALFAVLAAILFLESASWRDARPRALANGSRLRALSLAAAPIVYVQTVFGAWLRHSGAQVAQMIHVAFAVVVIWFVAWLTIELRKSGVEVLARVARWSKALLWTQVALGVMAWVSVYVITGPKNPVSISEALFATAHVACGAMLLAACTAAFVFVRRVAPAATSSSSSSAHLEAAR